jgi:hypothetical protein
MGLRSSTSRTTRDLLHCRVALVAPSPPACINRRDSSLGTAPRVHAPGRSCSRRRHGTYGLSRGVWASPLHHLASQQVLTEAVFAPLAFDASLVKSVLYEFELPTEWRYQPWHEVWDAGKLFHQCTVWFPPPEIARQALIFTLETWVEMPLTTSALFFIPRTLAGSW